MILVIYRGRSGFGKGGVGVVTGASGMAASPASSHFLSPMVGCTDHTVGAAAGDLPKSPKHILPPPPPLTLDTLNLPLSFFFPAQCHYCP